MTKLKRDEYFNLFDEATSFNEISKIFSVKKETIYDYFIEYIQEKDMFYYRKYFVNKLPEKKHCNKIIDLIKKNYDYKEIKSKVNKGISEDQILLVKSLYEINSLEKIRNEKSKLILADKYHILTSEKENKRKNIEKNELFNFLTQKDQHSFKITLGTHLSNEAIEWISNGEMIDKNILNDIDRKNLAQQFLKEKVIYRSLKRKKFKFKPSITHLIKDIAKQIDYKIPKNYYLKKRDLDFGYEDHSITSKEYEGIHNTPGLKYKYVENYIRDELANNQKKHSYIDLKKDILPYVENELQEYGFVLKTNKKINRRNCLSIIHFLRHDEKEKEALKYIIYEYNNKSEMSNFFLKFIDQINYIK